MRLVVLEICEAIVKFSWQQFDRETELVVLEKSSLTAKQGWFEEKSASLLVIEALHLLLQRVAPAVLELEWGYEDGIDWIDRFADLCRFSRLLLKFSGLTGLSSVAFKKFLFYSVTSEMFWPESESVRVLPLVLVLWLDCFIIKSERRGAFGNSWL